MKYLLKRLGKDTNFQWTAARTNEDKTVLFDSSSLFKD